MIYLRYVQPYGNRQTYTNTDLYINDMNFSFEFDYLYFEEQNISSDWSECLGTGYPGKFRFGSNPEVFVGYGGTEYDAPNDTVLDGAVTINKSGLWENGVQLISMSPASNVSPGYLTIGGDRDYPGDALVDAETKIGRLKVYHNNTLVADFVPAEDNGNVGFYDEVSQTFYTSDGNEEWIAGPVDSSIVAVADETKFKATGGTINIDVECENAWTVTGNTWLTLSSTGDTGSTTITATAPSYTGDTARNETLGFNDSVTGDDFFLTLTQRKYQAGQPFYLSGYEIKKAYVGDTEVMEAYVGGTFVFSSTPFAGLLVKPAEISFSQYVDNGSVLVKSSEDWEITSLPAWLSASTMSGTVGETAVEFLNTSQSADTADTITFSSATYTTELSASYATITISYNDGVRDENAPDWDLSNYLDTGIYVTGDEDTRIRVKYYGGGEFSDRIVGFDANECGSDAEDFRYFPSMTDAANGRINNLEGWYNNGQYYDITFGNLWVYDNLNNTSVANIGTYHGINTGTTIRIDMSVNWIKEVIIQREINGTWTDIADFRAAELGDECGLYDTINHTWLTKPGLTSQQ